MNDSNLNNTIVINPVLWFINQRMKMLRLDILLKLLLDYYSDDEIEKAMDELYNHFSQEFRPNNLKEKTETRCS